MSDFLLNVARRAAGIAPAAASIEPAAAPALDAWAGPEALEEGVEETVAPVPRAEPGHASTLETQVPMPRGETDGPHETRPAERGPRPRSAEPVPSARRASGEGEQAPVRAASPVRPTATEHAPAVVAPRSAGVPPASPDEPRKGGRDARAPAEIRPAATAPAVAAPAPAPTSARHSQVPPTTARPAPEAARAVAPQSPEREAAPPAPSPATLRPRVTAEQPLPRQQAADRAAAPSEPRIEVRIGRIDVEIAAPPVVAPAAAAPVRERPRGFDAYARLRAYGER